jgi:hypothetical protein
MVKGIAPMTKHYLITIDLRPAPAHMHSYLMCNDHRLVEHTIDRMFTEAEKLGLKRVLPMALVTELSTGKNFVREIVKQMGSKTLDHAKEYHLSTWTMTTDQPDDARLMELH